MLIPMVDGRDNLGEALLALARLAVRDRDRELSLTAASTLATMERSGPRRLTDLALSEGVTQPSMTAVVSQLEDLGLAERRSDPGDGRVVLVAITRAGRRYMRTMRRAGASVFATLIDKLTEHEVATLEAALPALHHLLDLAGQGQIGVGAKAQGATRPTRGKASNGNPMMWEAIK
jgi:DNA-binding MarR family transcriptional regulator